MRRYGFVYLALLLAILVAAEARSPQLKLSGCSQSSISWNGNCERAIDGNTNQHYHNGNSCSHTASGGWWSASTEKPARIDEVTIYNRQDCCSERLNNFAILVDGQECASYNSPTAFSVKTFNCGKVGKTLTIKSHLTGPLTLCEVQVFGEFVPQQLRLSSCSQSSISWEGNCERAIDGNTNQHYHNGNSCSHTASGGWWTAKTDRLAHIAEVKIYNRLDCCSERLNNFAILVDGQECASYNSPTAFSVKTFSCNKYGKSVMVRSHHTGPLTLCELQVFGELVPLSRGQLKLSGCSQSSISWEGNCERAIDGNTNQHYHNGNSCSHTASGGWWTAKTDRLAHFAEIMIYNRQDCCSERLNNFAILVDGQECASYNSPTAFSVKTFSCDKVGRTLTIKSHLTGPLTLCEVQVFGQLLG